MAIGHLKIETPDVAANKVHRSLVKMEGCLIILATFSSIFITLDVSGGKARLKAHHKFWF
jgi:hypothetical protein